MFDDDALDRSREEEKRWRAAYDRIRDRFGDAAPAGATQPESDSGLRIKNCYFPHDLEDVDLGKIGGPGSYPFTRGNLAAQYQLMNWANQPVIGYGLPEHTRQRMDLLAEQGMTGYFGSQFYNLVYDLVSHE
ncbi:MAG: methylmalonyl-CoA mutase family protein, partial [Sciscionella sp.]